MVQSARIQQIVKGDDVSLKHQIMGDVAYNAEASREPVQVQIGETVKFFYPLADGSVDLIGYSGVVVGSLPGSVFTVAIPGDIPAVVGPSPVPERGTKTWQSGSGRTVRAEITRSGGKIETHYLIDEVDIYERGFPSSLDDTSGGTLPVEAPLNLT